MTIDDNWTQYCKLVYNILTISVAITVLKIWLRSWSSLVSICHDCNLLLLSITSTFNCKLESISFSGYEFLQSSYESFLRSISSPNSGSVSKSGFDSMNWWTTEQTSSWIGRILWHNIFRSFGSTCSAKDSNALKSALSLWTVCKPWFCSLRRRSNCLSRRNCAQSKPNLIKLITHQQIWA